MKKNTILLSLIFTFILISCSDEEVNNESNTSNFLVKREYESNNINIQYRYNEDNNLNRIIDKDIESGIDDETNYTYDLNNIVESFYQSNNSNFSRTRYYSYDGNNRLVSIMSVSNNNTTPTLTHEFSYANNIITVDLSPNSGNSNLIFLEQNNIGLITKMTDDNNFTTINYNSQGNISKIEVFDNNNISINTSEFEYDDKPNPFYGQLKSIYLPLFLNAFDDAVFNEFVWDGYEGYYFPFSKNNITTIIENESLDRNYNYLYNAQNYPINVTEVFNGNNVNTFDIEY